MTRIDFYLNAESRLQVACTIAAKAVRQGMRVLVMAPDDAIAHAVDKLMWTLPATGFLPHCMTTDPLAEQTPVLIARSAEALSHNELLLNLGSEPPPAFSRFQRLVEIVGRDDEADKQAARQRFRFYKERGYELNHHDLAKAGPGGRNE